MASGQDSSKSLSSRSIVGAFWEFGSVLAQAVMQLVVMAILARLIPPEGFGLFAIVNTSIIIITLFSEIGVGTAVVQKKEITDHFLFASFILSIGLGLLGTVVTWVASPFIAEFFKQPKVVDMVRVAGLTLFISGYVAVATALLERELLFKKLALINITSYAIGYGCIGTILAILRVGAWAIVAATLSQNLIRALMLLIITRRKTARALLKIDFKEILRFCAGVSLGKVFNNLASQIDFLVVGRLMGPVPLGLYQMGNQIMDLPRRFLVGVIDRVMYTAFTRIQDDGVRMRSAYTQALELANVILVPLTTIMIIVAPEAIKLILGNKWGDLTLPLQIMLLQVPLRASVRMGDITGTAVGKVYTIGFLKMIYAGMIGIAAFTGVRWGLRGVTVAVSIAVLINLVMMVRFTMSYIKISVREYLQIWIPGCLLGALVLGTALPSMQIARNSIGSDLFRLSFVIFISIFVVGLSIWLRPRVVGKTALLLTVDFGKRIPLLSGVFTALEKRSLKDRRF